MKKFDTLTQIILAFLYINEGHKFTVPEITGAIFGTPSADSNHKQYRRVLRRVRKLLINGHIMVRRVNRHVPDRYYA